MWISRNLPNFWIEKRGEKSPFFFCEDLDVLHLKKGIDKVVILWYNIGVKRGSPR